MTIEEQVIERLRELSHDKQREVLEFVESLKQTNGSVARRSLFGLWADLNFEITEDDIARARREMWGNFPREISGIPTIW
jgi:hypothetical protein